MDVTSLIQKGSFEEAIGLADAQYAETKNILMLRNKVYALLHLERYEECILLTEQIRALSSTSVSTDFIAGGIATWLLGKKGEAVRLWKQAENCMYQDAAGGIETQVFLYFAAVKGADNDLKKEVVSRIKKLIKSKQSANWPGIVGHFLVDKVAEEGLLSVIPNIPILKERYMCQAHFAMAIKSLEKGMPDVYEERLKSCISYGPAAYLEQMYYLAKGEINITG